MTNDELLSLLNSEIDNSIGSDDQTLSNNRTKAMQYYNGEPFGDEVEGSSQFVSRDVADTVEGIMPSLMRIFASTEVVAHFEPQGREDVDTAEQVTDYVNYVFAAQNPGFVILYTFFKDALLQKNGFCKVYWEDYTKRKVETYSQLSPQEFLQLSMLLEADYQVKVLGFEQNEQNGSIDVQFELVSKYGKICVDPVPPEEIRVNKNAKQDLNCERFVDHERRVTASDLVELGFTKTDIEKCQRWTDRDDMSLERQARYSPDQSDTSDDDLPPDEATSPYVLHESYYLVDWDGDDIAERRLIWWSGKLIKKNEELDSVPIVTATPILMPHKLFGTSMYDLVNDLQLLKSTLLRQLLNNMYLTNNSRYAVLDGMVNIDDLLVSRPGGVVRERAPGAVRQLPVQFFGAPAFNMLQYVDQIREVRSGQRHFQGVDADALNKNTSGVAIDAYKAAALEKIELIARIFAETGVKDMMWRIFELAQKHERKARVIRLRNKWVDIDPRAWADHYDMYVNVGLGTGNKQTVINAASLIGQFQQQIVAGGGLNRIVTEANIYNLAHEVSEAVMPKKGDLFFTDPKGQPPPPPPPPDEKVQAGLQKAVIADKTKRDLKAIDFMTNIMQIEKTTGVQNAQLQDQQNQRQFDSFKQAADQQFQREQTDREKQDEHMRAQTQMQSKTDQSQVVLQAISGLQEAVTQLAGSMEQLTKAAKAKKRIITDDNGEPVGVEPVLEDDK